MTRQTPPPRRGRPGTGGRIRRTTPFTGTTATEELIRDFGQPIIEPHGRSQLLIWPVDPDGDGVIFSRLSGPEIQGGETALGQIHPLRDLAAGRGLTPRLVVVALHTSGLARFETRPDFAVVREGIDLSWCKWVAWRGPDRIARDVLPAELLYDLLRTNGVDLYLTSLGRAVDWDTDHVYLRSLGLASAAEAASIKARTQAAIRTRYIDMRRGWPGQRKFGFRRNPYTKFLEVDPAQWEFIKRIHYGYADAESTANRCLSSLAKELADLGCELSASQIRRCLIDRVYVDGRFYANVDGAKIEQQPIPLDDPIPEAVFQRNQELLALRVSRRTTTQVGEFCLNGVPIVHTHCAHRRSPEGYASHLRGRTIGGIRAYRHSPWIPKECRGLAIPQDLLEGAVIDQLREQFHSTALADAMAANVLRAHRGFTPTVITPEMRAQLRRQLQERRRLKAQFTRTYLESTSASDAPSPRAYWELVEALTLEIDQLELRLKNGLLQPSVNTDLPTTSFSQQLELLMTPVVPASAEGRVRRAALIQALIREIRVAITDGTLGIEIILRIPA